jgi:hypothetical protein
MYCYVTISVHLKSEIFEKNEKQNKLTTVKQFQNLIWKIIETGKIKHLIRNVFSVAFLSCFNSWRIS